MTTTQDSELINIGKASQEDLNVTRARLIVVIAMLILIYCTLSVRVVNVAMSGKSIQSYLDRDIEKAENDGEEEIFEYPALKKRADIIDRNGTLLAVDLATASLYANPKILLDADEAVRKLAKAFPDLSLNDLKERLHSDKTFVWIKRNLTPDEQYKVNALGLPGLYFKDEEKRVYPHKELMSHILGIVDIDGGGISGIEKKFDTYLRGSNDVGMINDPLQISVDVRVQSVVREALKSAVDEFKAIGGTGIVMDANTGEVIAMVSLPDFNQNAAGSASDDSRFNRATFGVYEMGSTMKTFTMALGFELGAISMTKSYDVSQPIKIGRFTIRDYHPFNGYMGVPEIFMESSNIGTAQIALENSPEEQRSFLERLGFLDDLPIELPETSVPLYPSNWSKASQITISYGHGISVTPMHVVQAISAMINGGTLNPATLLKKDRFNFFATGERVISKNTSDKIRKLLRLVVDHGTGSKANIEGYLVGGKTGSADKPSNGTYNRKSLISSFVGAFPMNKPKYTVMVMLDEPVGNARTAGYTTGGMVAAPVVGEIIAKAAPILGVMPVDMEDSKIKKEFWYKDDKQTEAVSPAADH